MARRKQPSKPKQPGKQTHKGKEPERKKREPRAWSVDSDSASVAGSEEGTPERLGAVRLEVGKSQLNWGDRGPSSGESGSSDESGSEEEDKVKRRVVVSGDEEDVEPPSKPEVIDLESSAEEETPARRVPAKSAPKRGHPSSGGLDDMFLSDHEPSQAPATSSGYTRAAKHPPRSSPPTGKRHRRHQRTPTPSDSDSESSEDPERIIASPPPYRRAPPVVKRRSGERDGSPRERKKRRKGKGRAVDPDDSDESEEEDPEALVKELEMDEPVVVESRLRERNKKTPHQIRLEALKRRKEAKSRGERYTSPIDLPADSSDEMIVGPKPSSSAPRRRREDPDEEESEGAWTVEDDEAMDGFIDDAEKKGGQEEVSNLLPEQYQMARYQNLEYHFKVISQFLIHLIIRGPTYARERRKQYYRSSYDAISRKLQGQKDSLVTSSVWKPDFKTSLETYPELVVSHLDEIEYGCDACHLTGRLSRFSGELRGKAYDRETFEDLDDQPDSDESEEEAPPPSRGPFKLGKFCRLRAEVFHEFSHWERSLYVSYKDAYGRLERRVRSGDAAVRALTARSLRDPDEVVQWLDSQGHIMSQFERLSGFEFDLQKLS